MLRLVVSDNLTVTQGDMGLVEYEAMVDSLSYMMRGAYHCPSVQRGHWDGAIRLLRRPNKVIRERTTVRFPVAGGPFFSTGLLPRLRAHLDEHSIEYTIDDRRTQYEIVEPPEPPPGITFRPEQLAGAERLITSRRGMAKLPPRSGKTLIIGMALAMAPELRPALILCEKVDVGDQIRDEVSTLLPGQIGLVGGGSDDIRDITVITRSSVQAAMKKSSKRAELQRVISQCKMVVVDECHHASNYDFLDKMLELVVRVGVSATPRREDGNALILEEKLGPIVFEYSIADAAREGRLLPPVVDCLWLPKRKLTPRADYQTVISDISFDEKRNHVISSLVQELNGRGHSVAIVVDRLPYGRHLQSLIPGSKFLCGEDDLEERKSTYRDLIDKKLMCLISTLINEAIDLPTLNAVIITVAGRSVTRMLQRHREMTASEGKTFAYSCFILDDVKFLRDAGRECQEELMKLREVGFQVRSIDGSNLYHGTPALV